ncbi:glycosyltransferase [Candidatus Peribacteria bacterium]|nr:glycosyltransferase [Candidatus Peribacteria bacterium]
MRVCLLTPVLDAFKGGNHLPLLAALPDVQFTILTSRTKPKSPDLPKNVTVETLNARIGPYYYGCADWMFARAVMHRYPPHHAFWKQFDAIHINQTMGPALLRLKESGVPVLFLIHHPVSADRAVALEESSGFEKLRWRMKYALLTRFQARMCRGVRCIATVSNTSAQRIARDYACDVFSIHIVPNGVNPDIFTPGDLGNSEFDVTAVGSFVHPRKGFRYLVDAYRLLSKKGMKIADVGRRSAQQNAILKGIPGVTAFGTVEEDQLVSIMQRSATLLSTSLYEGFGLSLIEALACGRPAFAFDAGAVRDVLSPIDPGFVAPLRDTQELVNRVCRFLALPPAMRAAEGKRYREAVTRLYPLSASAQCLMRLYGQLIA